MTQAKAKHLKDTMCNEFTKIFQLCEYVVVNNTTQILQQKDFSSI
jgi:exportin-1